MVRLEKNKEGLIVSGLIFVFCYICLVFLALRPPYAFDSFWHLQMGTDLIKNGLSPWVDHYSFTHYEKEIGPVPVLFQVILAVFVDAFGEKGFFSFKIFYITAFMMVLGLYFRQIKTPWFVVFLVLPFIVYFIHIRLVIRPEILSNILIIICLSLYIKARDNFGNKELLAITLLLLFWVNYHAPVFGYVIIFGLFVDKAVNKLLNKDSTFSWSHWVLWGVIIFLVGFINPEVEHFFILMLLFYGSDFSAHIQEYLPASQVFEMDRLVFLSWIVSFYLIVWSWLKKHYGFTFIISFLMYFSITTARVVPVIALIDFSVLAYFLSQISLTKMKSSLKPFVMNLIVIVSISVALLGYYILLKDIQITLINHENESKIINERYPVEVTDYLKRYQEGGNILNELRSGGYLLNKLAPDFKVYIDGRTNILYPVDFFNHVYEVMTNADKIKEEIERGDVQYAVFRNIPGQYSKFKDIDDFELKFLDASYLLFADKDTVGFPLASKLFLFPMCWDNEFIPEIKKEIELSNTMFDENNYTLEKYLNVIEGYLENDISLVEFNAAQLTTDHEKRLAAYISFNSKGYKQAVKYFSLIDNLSEYDVLMMAYSFVKDRQYNKAEAALNYFVVSYGYSNGDKKISDDVMLMFIQILSIVQEGNKLNIFPPSIIENFKVKIDLKDKAIPAWVAPHVKLCNTL